MLGFDRALVSNIPGTTRDLINSEVFYNSVNMELVDSAGIRETDDLIEKSGVALSGDEVKNSNLILVILDHDTEELLPVFKSKLSDKKHLVVFNKSDKQHPKSCCDCVVSAKSGDGVQKLKNKIYELIQEDKDITKKHLLLGSDILNVST